MHEAIKFYVTREIYTKNLREITRNFWYHSRDGTLRAVGKLALKTPNVFIKMAFFVDFAVFFRMLDGLLR
jgi:hypothetical protein